MLARRRVVASTVLIMAVIAPTFFSTASHASVSAAASLTLSSRQVEMHTPLTLSACVAKISKESKAEIQEAEGTGHVWHVVYFRTVPRGSTCFSSVLQLSSFGITPFRVVAYSGTKLVAVSLTETTTAFGPISVQVYLDHIGSGGWDSPGTDLTPGHTYATIGEMQDSAGGTPWTANVKTSCRSLTLSMVMSSNNLSYPDQGTATLSIQQNSLNEQTTPSFPDEQPYSFTFKLDGSISSWIYVDTDNRGWALYFLPGTTADCSTPTGVLS